MNELNDWVLEYTSGELSRLMSRFWLFFAAVIVVTAGWLFFIKHRGTGKVYLYRKLAEMKGHYALFVILIAYAAVCVYRTSGWAPRVMILVFTGVSVYFLFRLSRFGVIASLTTLWVDSAAVLIPQLALVQSWRGTLGSFAAPEQIRAAATGEFLILRIACVCLLLAGVTGYYILYYQKRRYLLLENRKYFNGAKQCPQCGLPVDTTMDKCPVCGRELADIPKSTLKEGIEILKKEEKNPFEREPLMDKIKDNLKPIVLFVLIAIGLFYPVVAVNVVKNYTAGNAAANEAYVQMANSIDEQNVGNASWLMQMHQASAALQEVNSRPFVRIPKGETLADLVFFCDYADACYDQLQAQENVLKAVDKRDLDALPAYFADFNASQQAQNQALVTSYQTIFRNDANAIVNVLSIVDIALVSVSFYLVRIPFVLLMILLGLAAAAMFGLGLVMKPKLSGSPYAKIAEGAAVETGEYDRRQRKEQLVTAGIAAIVVVAIFGISFLIQTVQKNKGTELSAEMISEYLVTGPETISVAYLDAKNNNKNWTEEEREAFTGAIERMLAVSARIRDGEELPEAYEEDGETLLAAFDRIDPLLAQLRDTVAAGGMPDQATVEKLLNASKPYAELVMKATLTEIYEKIGD
ncbi:MAG: zinc ribbon domain-containing protein [Firmicutes bacterium]|nr:zinc ribbon domain-containing protein [Bacillota bacterium]